MTMNLLTTTRCRTEGLFTKRNRKVGEEIVIRTQRKRELSRQHPGYVNGTVNGDYVSCIQANKSIGNMSFSSYLWMGVEGGKGSDQKDSRGPNGGCLELN